MLYKKCLVKESQIAGKGLFAEEDISKNELIGNLAVNCLYMSNEAYRNEDDPVILQTAIKYDDKTVLYGTSLSDEDYINHSCESNCTYKGKGILVSKVDIKKGDEILVDYREWMIENDPDSFTDKETGITIGE